MSKIQIEEWPIYSILDHAKNLSRKYVKGSKNKSYTAEHFKKEERTVMHEFFYFYLKEQYLFSTISHLDTSGQSLESEKTIYDFGVTIEADKKLNDNIKNLLDDLLFDIADNKALSITHAILKDIETAMFFYSGTKPLQIKEEFGNENYAIDLSKFKQYSNINDFINYNERAFEQTAFYKRSDEVPINLSGTKSNVSSIGRTIYYYIEIADRLRKAKEIDLYVYFIRSPLHSFVSQNGLLSLAVKKELTPEQYGLAYLIFHRFQSELYIEAEKEKSKINEQNEALKNISVSTHAIKTLINNEFSPILHSLELQYGGEERLKMLISSRDKLLSFSELINLMSKISLPERNHDEIKNHLKNSTFYSEKYNIINLKALKEKIIKTRNYNPNATPVEINIGQETEISKSFLEYKDIYPTENFYEFIVFTAIENVIKFGSEYVLNINYSNNKLLISNKSNRIKKKIDFTGNFRIFKSILQNLNIGDFNAFQDEKTGVFILEITHNANGD